MCLLIFFSAGMHGSQNTLIDTEQILQRIPNNNAAETLATFDGLVISWLNANSHCDLLLGHAFRPAGLFHLGSHGYLISFPNIKAGGVVFLKLISTKERLVHCYKYGYRFRVYEEIYEKDGIEQTYVSRCPFASCSGKQTKPKCNGLNEWGSPCPYASRPPENQ